MRKFRYSLFALMLSIACTSAYAIHAQQVIGNGPQGPICSGPLGPGPCSDVMRYLQQHSAPPPVLPMPPSTLQVIGNSPVGPICSGPLGPGPCAAVAQYIQQHPQGLPAGAPQFYQPLNFSSIGAQAQQIGIQCAQQSVNASDVIDSFISCAGQQVVLPQDQQALIDCAAQSGGQVYEFITCEGGNIIANQLTPEQQIAVQCVAETGGQPYAAAGCAATQLTVRELQKCFTDGIGGPNGCFGDNNDIVGRNGWTARTFTNVVNDIQHGPGPNNDLVGPNGFVARTAQNISNDIRNGPGSNNDLVGCNGFVNKSIFHGHC
jgi:hypothetical protein